MWRLRVTDLPLPTKVSLPPEEEALLRRCYETPWDDAPILIYSDWVQDHGDDARAEAIRKSLASARLTSKVPPGMGDWVKRALPAASHEAAWALVRGLPVLLVKYKLSEAVENFREYILGEADAGGDLGSDAVELLFDALDHALDMAAAAGWPVALSLETGAEFRRAGIARLTGRRSLRHVRVLRLETGADREDLKALANSKNLTDLWYLRLAGAAPGSAAERALRASKRLKNLRVIDGGP